MAKAKRTTHRSKTGKKLYAKRDSGGKFKDIQSYKRAHGADLKRKGASEKGKSAAKTAARRAKPVKAIPDGYHSVTPYLIVSGAGQALEFYKRGLGATEQMRLEGPGGKVMHAEFKIGNSIVMLADEFPEMDARSPSTIGGTPVGLCIYVKDVDALFKQALAAGATEERPVKDQFYGDRSGTLRDPYGHKWTIATHKEDLTPAEIGKRAQAAMQNQ